MVLRIRLVIIMQWRLMLWTNVVEATLCLSAAVHVPAILKGQ